MDGATVDGKTYAVPYYAGSKYIFYRKDLFEEAGLAVPTTTEEFVDSGRRPEGGQPRARPTSRASGSPARTGATAAAFIWNDGGDLAVEDGGAWVGSLSAPESVAGLETVQKLFEQASGAPKDGNEADPQTPVLRR